MTRVEKYRAYRKEILNSFYVEKNDSKKEKSSELVSKIALTRDDSSKMSYKEVLDAYKIYDNQDEKQVEKQQMSEYQKRHLKFVFICVGIIIILLVALILVGIKLFGG